MTDLEKYGAKLEKKILQRNARLRAWKSIDPCFEGAWEVERFKLFGSGDSYCRGYFSIYCLVCKRSSFNYCDSAGFVELIEKGVIQKLVEVVSCVHVKKLLGEDTEEIKAITQLELLTLSA